MQRIKIMGILNPSYKHGHNIKTNRSSTYGSWVAMKTRVKNPNRHNSHRYVGRGIDMDPRWENFETFLSDMGLRPEDKTLERKRGDLGYWPTNCCWATASTQRRNTSHCVKVLFDGNSILVVEALEKMGKTWAHYRHARWGRVRRTAQEAIDYLERHIKHMHPDYVKPEPG